MEDEICGTCDMHGGRREIYTYVYISMLHYIYIFHKILIYNVGKMSSFTALQYIYCVQREGGSEKTETCSLKLLNHKILIYSCVILHFITPFN